MYIVYCYLFFVGACFVSFSHALVYRLLTGHDDLKGRSCCETCHHQLSWYELIPVFSYLFLRGKCLHCQKHISLLHPLMECLGGMLAIFSFYRYGLTTQALLVFFICLDLLMIALIDQKTMTIYLSTLIILLVLVLGFAFLQQLKVLDMVKGALSVSVFMFLMNMIVFDSFGLGDIQLMFVSGIMLGWIYNVLAMIIAIITASMHAFYFLLRKKADRKTHMAFGPYLVLGIITALFFGSKIVLWYWRYFFSVTVF